MERIVLTTGGTGGHIFPALAVAEEIRRRTPEARILFIGGLYGPEGDLAAKAGLDFIGLPVRGVMGRGIKGVFAVFGLMRGFCKAVSVLRKFKPQAVVGFGGYAAFAGVCAAIFCGIPTALHEQNSFPGMVNRLLGKRVKRIFLSMPDASGSFPPKKCVMTGNPVRAAIAALAKTPSQVESAAPAKSSPRLLVLGGSLGAKAINRAVGAGIEALLEEGVSVRHQTGQTDYEAMRALYREAGADDRVQVEAFIDDMAKAYAEADLVLSRAGATSLAELAAAGKPAVLVPFPFAAQDHQRFNARWMQSLGAAVMLDQNEISADNPVQPIQLIIKLLRDKEKLASMAQAARAAAKPEAAQLLADNIEELAAGRCGRAGK